MKIIKRDLSHWILNKKNKVKFWASFSTSLWQFLHICSAQVTLTSLWYYIFYRISQRSRDYPTALTSSLQKNEKVSCPVYLSWDDNNECRDFELTSQYNNLISGMKGIMWQECMVSNQSWDIDSNLSSDETWGKIKGLRLILYETDSLFVSSIVVV